MEQKKFVECLRILSFIEEQVLLYPKESRKNNPRGGYELMTWEFKLPSSECISFLLNLEEQKILKMTSRTPIPAMSDYSKGSIYNEDGSRIETDDFVITYINVNLKKLRKYKQSFKSVLTLKQTDEILYKSGIDLSLRIPMREKSVGDLELYNDDTIRIHDEIITLPKRLKKLCKIFIEAEYETVGEEEIYDILGMQSKQREKTLRQYISDLNKELKKPLYSDKVFMREELDGSYKSSSWRFNVH